MKTLQVFNKEEKELATNLLSAKVASMLGRKMEEGDWDFVYCNAKKIPLSDWSNLNIDVNHNGLGVEHKMLRITKKGSIFNECGTTKMHPAGTRSIRIPPTEDPNEAMKSVISQYCDLIDSRRNKVIENSDDKMADMRIGWLLWKESLDEFLYFEEEMLKPNVDNLYASWNETPAKGARKSSKSLWIFEKNSGKKVYSVTTAAGAKIQPYFDVPPPNDPNLYYFKVQGVNVGDGLVQVWLTKTTAQYLELLLGGLDKDSLSEAIRRVCMVKPGRNQLVSDTVSVNDIAVPVMIDTKDYDVLKNNFEYISDEYIFQQLAIKLSEIS